ncbi:hypothetical protein [uncultured Senegalimassilia sp.]|uniref:hypothetical protein n=1 Tax=uncultured Senegalimassilia sp. TaxID=1714350 RepID=UPI002671B3D4|nr:hypothetical protein [uncultured Senegalimassilia sp.]
MSRNTEILSMLGENADYFEHLIIAEARAPRFDSSSSNKEIACWTALRQINYPVEPYEANSNWTKRKLALIRKREHQLFNYFVSQSSLENARNDDSIKTTWTYFTHGANKTASIVALQAISRRNARRREIDKLITSAQLFCEGNGRLPKQGKAGNAIYEREMRLALENARTSNFATSNQIARVNALFQQYKTAYPSVNARLEELVAFCKRNNRWPRTICGKDEQSLYSYWTRQHNVDRLRPAQKRQFQKLLARYNQKRLFRQMTSDEILHRLQDFIDEHGHYPRAHAHVANSSPTTKNGQLYETRLYKGIRNRVQNNQFNDKQLQEIEHLQEAATSRRTSQSEKMPYQLLCSAFANITDPNIRLQEDTRMYGHSIDIAAEISGQKYAIFYDGEIHSQKYHLAHDREIDRDLAKHNVKCIRVRSSSLVDCPTEALPHILPKKEMAKLNSSQSIDLACAIANDLNVAASQIKKSLSSWDNAKWNELKKSAHAASSTSTIVAKNVSKAIEMMTAHGDNLDRSRRGEFRSLRVRLRAYMPCGRNIFLREHLELLAFTESKFCPKTSKSKPLFARWLDEYDHQDANI